MERDDAELAEGFRRFRRERRAADRDHLVEMHVGLAHHCARRFADRGESLDDLNQVALMGLVKAVDRFDPEQGTPFAGFAVPTILGELRRYFRDATWAVHVPRRAKDLHVRMGPAAEALQQRLGRSPTPDELAQELGVGVDDVLEAAEAGAAYRPHRLDAPAGPDGPGLGERLASPGTPEEVVEARVLLGRVMGHLPEREQRILELRFVHEMSQSEIAEQVGISQMHVSRLLRRALETMKDQLISPETS